MKKTLTIVVGFLHDFAAGCWAASVFGIYWLSRRDFSPEVQAIIFGLKKELFWAGVVCVLTVFATGAGRSFTYVDNVYGEDTEKKRRRMLIIKHIFLILIFGLGILWQYIMVF
jgi:hypothetical protein